MDVKTAVYQGQRVRYLVLPDGGVLLNTRDICAITGATDRPRGSDLAEPCLDVASALQVAHNDDFARWLTERFASFHAHVSARPTCDDTWTWFH